MYTVSRYFGSGISRTAIRQYSSSRGGFFSRVLDNLKNELSTSKEMKENLNKFREEAQRLEQSDALKEARRKFEVIESEASKGSNVLKDSVGSVTGKLNESLKDVAESELVKKAGSFGGMFGKQAQNVLAGVANTTTFKAVSGAASVVENEIEESAYGDQIYRAPQRLRKRIDDSTVRQEAILPNEEATGVELHKDSRFYQAWENFKGNNQYVHKLVDWKMQYDESNNPLIRASRLLTEKVTEMMGGLFQRTEMSQVLTEIMTLDPAFEKERFLRYCEKDIIPNILEAVCRQDLEILRDWCYDAAYAMISQPIEACKQKGVQLKSKILDISNVDLVMGRMLDQGPVLVITFTAQTVQAVLDAAGRIVEGDPEKILKVNHAWVLCREREELDPRAAWRLLEFSSSATEQMV